MELGTKRRKTTHSQNGGESEAPIDLGLVSTASTFSLEVDELLKDVKVDYDGGFAGALDLLKELRGLVESIEPHGPQSLSDATDELRRKGVRVPYPEPAPEKSSPYQLRYAKPSKVNVVGSYISRTMVRSQPNKTIDMVVEMPMDLFEAKDYSNMRYLYRRAYFLAYLTLGVNSKSQDRWDLEYAHLHGNLLLPVLSIRPRQDENWSKDDSGQKPVSKRKRREPYVVRIIPIAPWGVFPASKLVPSRNCNKMGRFEEDQVPAHGTPFYNSTLKAEGTFLQYLSLLTQAKKSCSAFTSACVLGRIWLGQRGLGSSIHKGGFGHFEWSVLLALLPGLSSSPRVIDLFKKALKFLALANFDDGPVFLGSRKGDVGFVKEDGPVLYDAARELNIVFKMTLWSMALLKFHAKSTLELLQDHTGIDQFEPTFITKVDLPQLTFDTVVELDVSHMDTDGDAYNGRGISWNHCEEVYRILKRALSDRARLVHITWPEPPTSSVASDATKHKTKTALIRVVFDPENMARRMEYGPKKEEENKAKEFRAFWGEKSELRKFKEKGIIECIEWPQGSSAFEVFEHITKYILELRLGVQSGHLKFHHADYSDMVDLSVHDKASFDVASQAFRDFETHMRSLEGMPLQIRRLSAVSPSLRHASRQTPLSVIEDGRIEPMEVMLYFEASNQWPENLVAIQETKLEFLLDMAKRLDEASGTRSSTLGRMTATYLGRDDTELGVDNLGYLDVVYETRFAFRIRIHSEAEETFLQRQVMNTTLDPRVRTESAVALANFRWRYVQLPLHSQKMLTFCVHSRFAALSPTTRLVKKWFSAQRLARHFSDELIEILVLYVFLNPQPWQTPTSVATGFAQVLCFLARWDWKEQPVVVDFGNDISAVDRAELHRLMETWRDRDPNRKHYGLFVATSHVRNGLDYTRLGPLNMAAMRMTSLAKAVAETIRQVGMVGGDGCYQGHDTSGAPFHNRLSDYHAVLQLSSQAIGAVLADVTATPSSARQHSQFRNLDARMGKAPMPPSRHPKDVLLAVLEEKYGESIGFFSGGPEDMAIGLVWMTAGKKEKFRVGLGYNFRTVADGDGVELVEVNKEAVLAEIARIGGVLIKKIDLLV